MKKKLNNSRKGSLCSSGCLEINAMNTTVIRNTEKKVIQEEKRKMGT